MTKADDFVNAEFKQAGEGALSTGGLTKREYFAIKILSGMYADGGEYPNNERFAVLCADKLIEELNK